MFSLEGKTALVTGASGGIGSSIAYALAKQGARLALSGSNSDKLRAFREQLNSEFGHDHVEITCDLSNAKQVEELIPATVDTLGSMNILVNNAGITRDNLAMRMKDEEWDDVIRINLEASFRLTALHDPERLNHVVLSHFFFQVDARHRRDGHGKHHARHAPHLIRMRARSGQG